MLMLHRINHLERDGARGSIIAECDVGRDDWFFDCHFRGDPVQPGCLGVDAVWQLLGFFCLWSGAVGSGRALGCKEVVFDGEIRPWNHVVRYEVSVRRIAGMSSSETTVAIGTGSVFVDDRQVYTIRDAKTGVFPNIARTEAEHAAAGGR
jgi:3-hydroxyacyl-[acyl-carrier protein] dehydratase/trans-2-decenoyl-[acyl-carrier protein] isomerase